MDRPSARLVKDAKCSNADKADSEAKQQAINPLAHQEEKRRQDSTKADLSVATLEDENRGCSREEEYARQERKEVNAALAFQKAVYGNKKRI